MKPGRWPLVCSLALLACQNPRSNKGDVGKVPPVEPEASFTFEDGTVKKLVDMREDADCAALVPKIASQRMEGDEGGRGLVIIVRDEQDGSEKRIYCWRST